MTLEGERQSAREAAAAEPAAGTPVPTRERRDPSWDSTDAWAVTIFPHRQRNIPGTLLTPVGTLLTRLAVIQRTLLTNQITPF